MAEDPTLEARVVGLDELVRESEDLAHRIGKAAPGAMRQAADKAAARVRSSAPVDTGALVGSVTTGTEEGQAFVGMGEGLPYAGWIEYGGTRGRPYVDAGRYVYPAAQAVTPDAVAAATRATEKEIGGYPWSRPRL